MGAVQRWRTLLITVVVALCLIVGTAAQAGQEWTDVFRRLVVVRSLDWSAPILEELVFRGIVVAELLNWTHDSSRTPVELRVKFWGGQVGAAAVFVAVHWPYWVSHFGLQTALSLSLPVFVTGLILGFVFATTRSLWGCIALHGLNNALSQLT
jgi:membrane protease YdiL (CAAX protease family)